MKQAHKLLKEWGIWTWQDTGVPRYVSPLLALIREHDPEAVHGRKADISEDDAYLISSALARLHVRYREASEAIHLHYRDGLAQAAVAEQMEIKRGKARELIQAGEAYVQAVLDLAAEVEVEERRERAIKKKTLALSAAAS